ncbi:Aldo-ket-red domain-containing protein [Mycena kentingensis (nom. inval.)]|nr:Aldo-ket-red domain-containing protein [Mycena kentingensis (nom. inval.)]
MSHRLASFKGPSTPSSSPVPKQTTKSPAASPSRAVESTYHRKTRAALLELRGLTEFWEDLVLLDGLKAARSLVDARTDLDNALALAPNRLPRQRIVAPKIELMEKRIAELDLVILKLQKQFRKMNAAVDGLEAVLIDAHRAKGCQWASEEPLWVTWSLEKFVTAIPALLPPYHRSLNSHIALVDTLRSHSVSFEDARDALAKWIEQPWLEDDGWEAAWEDLCTAEVDKCYDAGINAFDTANIYSNGLSEEVLGRALKKHSIPREEVVIMTKVYYGLSRDPNETLLNTDMEAKGYVNQYGLSRKHIFDSVKASLRRLQLDYVDVLQCHRFDDDTPIEETMNALHDVVKAGYVRYIGMSSCYAYQFHAMQNYAITNKLTPFISMQNHYNLLFGVGAIPWSPLARGAVTRPIEQQLKGAQTTRAETDFMPPTVYTQHISNRTVIERVEEIAAKHGAKMAQIGIAWMLAKEGVSAPIFGTTSLKNLFEAVDAIHIKLTAEEIKYLEEPYQPMPVLGIGARD